MIFRKESGQGTGLGLTMIWTLGKCIGSSIRLSCSRDNLEVEEGEELSPSVLLSIEWVRFPEVGEVLVVCVDFKLLSIEVVLPFLKSLYDG